MLKAEELRVGDLVYVGYSGTCEIIHGIIEKDVNLIFNGGHYHGLLFKYETVGNKVIELDCCHAIPLTEEWLLKFGWIWNEECESYEKYPNGDARMHISNDMSSGFAMFNYVLKATICRNIMYVHQLQNIYFALTGKELTTEIKANA